jgi:hypothetical protein
LISAASTHRQPQANPLNVFFQQQPDKKAIEMQRLHMMQLQHFHKQMQLQQNQPQQGQQQQQQQKQEEDDGLPSETNAAKAVAYTFLQAKIHFDLIHILFISRLRSSA